MKIWQGNPDLAKITERSTGTMVDYLGIEFTELTENSLTATMPVDHRTKQPAGILHGGANVVLAETLGSVAGNLCVTEDKMVVGLEINANHLRAVGDGIVTGTATVIHLGKSTQVWEIRIVNADNKLSCLSRLTLAVIDRR